MKEINEDRMIELIQKLIDGTSTEEEDKKYTDELKKSLPFYDDVLDLIFWSNEERTARQIYEKAKEDFKPIIL